MAEQTDVVTLPREEFEALQRLAEEALAAVKIEQRRRLR